jgi:hypothetical protein
LERDGDRSMEQLRDRDFDRGPHWLFTGMGA